MNQKIVEVMHVVVVRNALLDISLYIFDAVPLFDTFIIYFFFFTTIYCLLTLSTDFVY